ncbi:hypothetical protein D3C84_604980 [compost metagenome]
MITHKGRCFICQLQAFLRTSQHARVTYCAASENDFLGAPDLFKAFRRLEDQTLDFAILRLKGVDCRIGHQLDQRGRRNVLLKGSFVTGRRRKTKRLRHQLGFLGDKHIISQRALTAINLKPVNGLAIERQEFVFVDRPGRIVYEIFSREVKTAKRRAPATPYTGCTAWLTSNMKLGITFRNTVIGHCYGFGSNFPFFLPWPGTRLK